MRFDFDPHIASADLILTREDGSRVVLEVGFRKKEKKQAGTSITNVKGAYGLVACKGELSFDDDRKVATIPREWLLLAT
jgi:hypothetical protein